MNFAFVEDNYLLWERTNSFSKGVGMSEAFMLAKWESTIDSYAGALTRLGHRCVKFVPSLKAKTIETIPHTLGHTVVKVPCKVGPSSSLLTGVNWRLGALSFTKQLDAQEFVVESDLVHYHSYYSTFFLVSPSLKSARRRTVQYTGGRFQVGRPQRSAAMLLLRRALRASDGVLVDPDDPESVEQKRFLLESVKLSPEKVYPFATIMVDSRVFKQEEKGKSRKLLGVDPDSFVILGVSSVMDDPGEGDKLSKNPFRLVRLFAKLVEIAPKGKKIELHIVGGGSGLDALKSLVKQLGVDGQVKIHGIVPHELVSTFISASDLVFVPYHFDDLKFGAAVFEAFACNRPVCGFKRLDGTPAECQGGFLVDQGLPGARQLTRRIEDGEYLARKAEEGRRLASSHDVLTLGRELESTFEAIIGESR